jgi:SET domain-containing protein
VVVDTDISTEPFFVANRDIMAGEEITNNYHELDEAIKTKEVVPDWLN